MLFWARGGQGCHLSLRNFHCDSNPPWSSVLVTHWLHKCPHRVHTDPHFVRNDPQLIHGDLYWIHSDQHWVRGGPRGSHGDSLWAHIGSTVAPQWVHSGPCLIDIDTADPANNACQARGRPDFWAGYYFPGLVVPAGAWTPPSSWIGPDWPGICPKFARNWAEIRPESGQIMSQCQAWCNQIRPEFGRNSGEIRANICPNPFGSV